MENRSGQATIVGGRLVYGAASKRPQFSWLRCIAVLSVLLYLHVSNPANFYPSSQQLPPGKRPSGPAVRVLSSFYQLVNSLSQSIPLPKSTVSAYERRRTTNYWLFSVKDRTTKCIVTVGGIDLDCYYDDEEFPLIGVTICQNMIQQHMTHQKPLIYHPKDLAYTTHRSIAWILFAAAVLSFCFTYPIVVRTRFVFLDSLATFLFARSTQSPFLSFANRLVSLNVLIYPVLQAMETTVRQQSPNSFFVISQTDESINFCFSLLIWIALAGIVNTASKSWTGEFLLQFHSLTAVGMGYFARYQDSGMAPLWDWMLEPDEVHEAWTFITWTMILILAVRSSVATAVFWCLAHCSGQMLYQYQYDHLVLIATARSFTNWVNSVAHTTYQMLFGKPHYHQKVGYR
jgi:hypothetical protein